MSRAGGRGAGEEVNSVRLQSSDGEVFEVSLKVARLSRTLETMLRDLGHEPDDLIPLPKVNSRILKKILGWAEHEIQEQLSHHQPQVGVSTTTSNVSAPSSVQPPPTSPTNAATPPAPTPFQPRPQTCVPQRSSRQLRPPPPRHTLTDWEKEFISKNKDELYDLLQAANYLDIKSLLDVLCRTVADLIKGTDPEEIRRRFHVSNSTHLNSDTPPSSPSPQLHPSPSTHHTPHNARWTTCSADSCTETQDNDKDDKELPEMQLGEDRETPV